MITGELRSEVDKLWLAFHSGGITDPLTTIQQITYLLFLRRLDEIQTVKENKANRLGKPIEDAIYQPDQSAIRWSSFKDLDPEQMYEVFTEVNEKRPVTAFNFIKTVGGEGSQIARFFKDATFMINSPYLLDKVVQMVAKINMSDLDTKGDLYEYLLSKLTMAGKAGQFRTPRHIIKMMVEMTQPQLNDKICDPSAGTAGFLVAANEYLRQHHADAFLQEDFKAFFNKEMFTGIEFDAQMMRIGAMNLILHGIEQPNLLPVNALSEQNPIHEEFSLILANPPFKGTLDYERVNHNILQVVKTKSTELLFLALMLRMLRTGGRCAVIVPDGVLFGSNKAYKIIRRQIIEKHQLQAVISMPSGVFKPYAGVSTAVLFFTKTNAGGSDKVWFYGMEKDGFSLDDKRTPKPEQNDIPDIIQRWKNSDAEAERKRTDQSFYVPVQEIIDNDWDLSFNRYREIVYEEVQYDPPSQIMADLEQLNREQQDDLQALKSILNL